MVTVLLLLGVLQILATRYHRVFWLNLTESEPLGLYHLYSPEEGIKRGDIVIIAVPEEFRRYVYGRGWLPEGWPMLKHVGAIAGDSYCVEKGRLIVNGSVIGPVYATDHEGRPLPRVEGCRKVPAGYFLPVATHIPRSFDGRYMGAVKLAAIQGVARPLVTLD